MSVDKQECTRRQAQLDRLVRASRLARIELEDALGDYEQSGDHDHGFGFGPILGDVSARRQASLPSCWACCARRAIEELVKVEKT